jgi:hypothetical protein
MEGAVHEKVDIKVLMLYLLNRLPDTIERDWFADVCYDNGIEYFDFSDCLYELVESGHIKADGDELRITDKGRKNSDALERTLSYSIRKKADSVVKPVANALARYSNITADISPDGNSIHLALSDGIGSILDMQLFCGSLEKARKIRKSFRKNAEDYYKKIIEMLS